MRTLFLAFLAVAFSSCLIGCFQTKQMVVGSGIVGNEKRPVETATKLQCSLSGDIVLKNGLPNIEIDADDNFFDYIETVVNNDKLTIKFKDNLNYETKVGIKITVTMPQFEFVGVSGASKITADQLNVNDLEFKTSGSSEIELNEFHGERLTVGISGSGSLKASGTVKTLTSTISGSGQLDTLQLTADQVMLKISGSGDANVNANKSLDVKVSGSGDVRYTGDAVVTQKISGSGSVTKK